MIEITEYACQILYNTLNDNLHKSNEYGSPPIFYWYRNMIEETRMIESYRYLMRGEFRFKLGHSLGVAYVTCQYVGRKRFLIVTNYDINSDALFSWQNSTDKSSIIPKDKLPKPRKPYRMLTTKPLYGYRFVMNDKKEYNLIDSKGNLITRWFRAIKPVPKPFGQYNVIAYINVGGFAYCLCMDGKTWSTERPWKELFGEGRNTNGDMLFEDKYRTQRIIRLTESDLKRIIIETLTEILIESA